MDEGVFSPRSRDFRLNDHLYSEALDCPLRLGRTMADASNGGAGMPLKWRTRRVLRLIYCHSLPEPDLTGLIDGGLAKVARWVESEEPGVIRDLRVEYKGFQTRIPILRRQRGGALQILQLQGRRWSPSRERLTPSNLRNPTFRRYLFQLAYRRWVFRQVLEPGNIELALAFPSADFKAPGPGLFDMVTRGRADADRCELLRGAFASVDVTEQVDRIVSSPLDPVHPLGGGSKTPGAPLPGVMQWESWVRAVSIGGGDSLPDHAGRSEFLPGPKCVHCHHRHGGSSETPGCWEHHAGKGLRRPDLHVPDLPGHGNDQLLQRGTLFMEQLTPDDVPDAEPEPSSYSIQWRRSVLTQLARDGRSPAERLHPDMPEKLHGLRYPLHFIDFEACTFPVPLSRGGRMHDPVAFQYSCHTIARPGPLQQSGIRHHHWIDDGFEPDPERSLMRALSAIPDIEAGTLVHFAPFEPQHLAAIGRRAAHWGEEGEVLAERHLVGPFRPGRFLDLAAWLREGYHHPNLQGGLGLKDLMRALSSAPHLAGEWAALSPHESGLQVAPGGQMSLLSGKEPRGEGVSGGEEAMHAYLLMRAGEVSESRRAEWLEALRRYCTLDTFSMVLAVRHWQWLLERGDAVT